MKDLTDEEYNKLDEKWTKTTPSEIIREMVHERIAASIS